MFYPDAATVALAVVSPLVADRDFRLICAFTIGRGTSGVIFALGDPIAGMALFARSGRVTFVYHGGTGEHVTRDELPVTDGANVFVLEHRALGERKGRGTIVLNGVTVEPAVEMSPTLILGWVGAGLDVGLDRKQHVSALYGDDGPFRYTDAIEYVRIDPGAHPPGSYANRPERESQRD